MKHFTASFRDELINEYENILQYWMKYTVDEKNGGFFGEVDSQNNPVAKANKGAVLNTRILWTFSSAYNFLKKDEYLLIAHRAYNYLVNYFIDKDKGGVFWSLDYKGNMLDGRKQIYAQGFAIYGLSEYYRATNNKESLNYAIELFSLIEQYSFDSKHDGYLEALSLNWGIMSDMRLSAKDANEPKSMNTHLHIIEPYTNLYRVWPNEVLAAKMKGLIRVFLDKIIDSKTAHFNLFFDMDWSVKSSMVSYGHDIEGAWLLCEAAEVLGDKELIKEVENISIRMTDAAINEGLAADNSIFYEKEMANGHLEQDRHWWPQAEAMVGFMNAWQLTADGIYKEKLLNIWEYIKDNIIDKVNGEWFTRIDENGNHIGSDSKAGFWKCPYHNTRALMEVANRIKL